MQNEIDAAYEAAHRLGFARGKSISLDVNNLAHGCVPTVSSTYHNDITHYGPVHLTDGDPATVWSPNSKGDQTVTIDLKEMKTFNCINIQEKNFDRISSFTMKYSINGTNDTTLTTETTIGANKVKEVYFQAVTAKKISITFNSNDLPNIGEIKIYNDNLQDSMGETPVNPNHSGK